MIGRLLAWLFPDPCAGSAEVRRQMQSIDDDAAGAVFINCRTSADDPARFILEDW